MDPWVEFALRGLLWELLIFTIPGIIVGIIIGYYFL
jgi:hypothetical protein